MIHAVIYTSRHLSDDSAEKLSEYVDQHLSSGMPIVLPPDCTSLQFLDDGFECEEVEDDDFVVDIENGDDGCGECLSCRLLLLEAMVDDIHTMLRRQANER